ncbi:MAG: hypothetical protein J6A80_03535 [Lachnospiraceae bacterium]|nr:hypothetical protein [Lachnospiraceae bacterium]
MGLIGIVTLIVYIIGTGFCTGLLVVALALSHNIKLGDSKGEFKDFSGRRLRMLKENYDPGMGELFR